MLHSIKFKPIIDKSNKKVNEENNLLCLILIEQRNSLSIFEVILNGLVVLGKPGRSKMTGIVILDHFHPFSANFLNQFKPALVIGLFPAVFHNYNQELHGEQEASQQEINNPHGPIAEDHFKQGFYPG